MGPSADRKLHHSLSLSLLLSQTLHEPSTESAKRDRSLCRAHTSNSLARATHFAQTIIGYES